MSVSEQSVPAPAKTPLYKRVWFWLVIVGVVVLLAFAGCAALVVNTVGSASPDELDASASPTANSSDDAEALPNPTEGTSPSAEAEEPSPAAQVGTQARPAPYGTAVEVGDWTVTVNTVNAETANADIAAANEFNDAASKGQYVLVNLTAVYDGEGEGTAWVDLSARLIGTDKVLYDNALAVIPDDLSDQPSVLAGGSVTGNLAIDASPDALGDKTIAVTGGLISQELAVWSSTAS